MPSRLTIDDSSNEPTPTEHGGELENLDSGKTGDGASRLVVEEADTRTQVPVLQGGRVKKIRRLPRKGKRWFDDDRENPLHVRQWVYDFIVGGAVAVFLLSFLAIVIVSVLYGQLDFRSFLGEIGTFLGGLGLGYYKGKHGGKRHEPPDDDGRREGNVGNDSS